MSVSGGKNMKRLVLFFLVTVFVVTSSIGLAAETAPLGYGNLALKVDRIWFTEDEFDDFDLESGWYVGLEGFSEVSPGLYAGLEVGWASSDGGVAVIDIDVDTELTYVPVELNVKYALEVAPMFIIDWGVGVSYNYADIELKAAGKSDSDDEWLFGGQFFVDLNYIFDQFFLSINGKYQITEEGDDVDVSFDNWRIGGQIGIFF